MNTPNFEGCVIHEEMLWPPDWNLAYVYFCSISSQIDEYLYE